MTNEGVNPGERAPQVSTEASTADECGPVPIELPVDPLAHLLMYNRADIFVPIRYLGTWVWASLKAVLKRFWHLIRTKI